MAVYAIFLNEPNDRVWANVREKWADKHFILTENMAFVGSDKITTTADISKGAGLGGETAVTGLVFELHAYNGFNRGELWEWLGKVRP